MNQLSPAKKVLFFAIMLAIPLSVPIIGLLGYYSWQKLSWSAVYCGAFGQLDNELGWVLRPGTQSCFGLRNPTTGQTYFHSTITTNADGFRAPARDTATPVGAIVAIGDSNTFGYGVDYSDSYPALLEQASGRPVINLGVPAYGIAQTEMLFKRHVKRLHPSHVVLFDLGMWLRSVCRGKDRPSGMLRPCYWWNEGEQRLEFLMPVPDRIANQAAMGVYPGGYLTAGQDSWAYFLVSRPIIKAKEVLAAHGLWPEVNLDYDHDPVMARRITAAAVRSLAELALKEEFRLVVVDPTDSFAAGVAALPADLRARLVLMGKDAWEREVLTPSLVLPPEQQHVPVDGHYAGGVNKLLAEAVAHRLGGP